MPTVGTERRKKMKEVFHEYGGIIVAIVAIVALTTVIRGVVGGEAVSNGFTQAITDFFSNITYK